MEGYDCHALPASDAIYCRSSFYPKVAIMAVDVSSPIECWGVRGFYNFHKKLFDGVYLWFVDVVYTWNARCMGCYSFSYVS